MALYEVEAGSTKKEITATGPKRAAVSFLDECRREGRDIKAQVLAVQNKRSGSEPLFYDVEETAKQLPPLPKIHEGD